MKTKYDPRAKRMWNQRYYQKKKQQGWKVYSFCLPTSIGDELLELKRRRMLDLRQKTLGRQKLDGD